MSDKRASLTPIIVGAVIGLLGILVGLYIADNAREQLAAVQAQSATEQQEEAGAATTSLPVAEEQPALQELPPLEPVVQEPEVLPVEEELEEQPAEKEELKDTTDQTEVAVPEEPVKVEEEVEPVEEEIDEFEEVPLEDINN